jgi:hypothetical protein
VTTLQLTSGKALRFPESYERMRDLLEAAIASGKLLELRRSDGRTVLLNPNNVDYIVNSAIGSPRPAPAKDHTAQAV